MKSLERAVLNRAAGLEIQNIYIIVLEKSNVSPETWMGFDPSNHKHSFYIHLPKPHPSLDYLTILMPRSTVLLIHKFACLTHACPMLTQARINTRWTILDPLYIAFRAVLLFPEIKIALL